MLSPRLFVTRVLLPVFAGSVMSACTPAVSTLPREANHVIQTTDIRRCRDLFADLVQATEKAGVTDAQDTRIPGFPYLRVNRFLTGLRSTLATDVQESQWTEHLRLLALSSFKYELLNLPAGDANRIGYARAPESYLAKLDQCSKQLVDHDLKTKKARTALRALAETPDEYADWQRAAGIYPLIILPVAWGIDSWQEETLAAFRDGAVDEKAVHKYVTYGPDSTADRNSLTPTQVARILKTSADNPLEIPLPNEKQLQQLFHTFAPIWQVDSRDQNDQIGRLEFSQENSEPIVAVTRPTIYLKTSHTRFENRILLQLNYIVWFPARPKSGLIDLLGGKLDGITWRVTLDSGGTPLLYDSIHNCGCYHLFFPGSSLVARTPPDTLAESALVPGPTPPYQEGNRIRLRIDSATHYLHGVSMTSEAEWDRTLNNENYDRLRAIPLKFSGYRSVFDEDGIITVSARNERYIFWPLGVPAPGAMRQWGHHATAFIGKRHFDDIDLINRFFYKRP